MRCIYSGSEKNEGNKWKNHFVEMKGDVGMSVHEKGGKQVNAYIASLHQHTRPFITPSLHLCSFNIKRDH